MKYTLFPGCKVPYFVPYYETSSRAVLERFGIELADQEFTCCGYPIRFLDFQAFVYSSARNLALAGEKGQPLLCLCQCCYGTLRYADLLLRKNEALFKQTAALLKEEGLRYPAQIEIKHVLHVFSDDIGPQAVWTRCGRRSSTCLPTGQRRTPSVVVSPNRMASMRSTSSLWHSTESFTAGRFFFIWMAVV